MYSRKTYLRHMYSEKQIVKNEVYLYSLWSGQFKVYKGRVLTNSHREGYFVNTSIPNAKGRIICALDEGIVYNVMVWFEKRDDERAKIVLIDYEENQISKLMTKIDNHLTKIKLLKGD